MNNLDYSIVDREKEFFETYYQEKVNNILQAKLGEQAIVNCDVTGTELGEMTLIFEVCDMSDELMNFAEEISICRKYLKSIIDKFDITVDVQWQEEPRICYAQLYFEGTEYYNSPMYRDLDNSVKEILESLLYSIEKFVDNTLLDACIEFNEDWIKIYNQEVNN